MYDSKLAERMKNFRGSKKRLIKIFQDTSLNLLRKREEYSLNLRKNKLFESIMEKRLNSRKFNNLLLEIDPAKLNIPQVMKETLENAENDAERSEYVINWIVENEDSSMNGVISDVKKFAIYKFRTYIEDLELAENQELEINNNLILVLLYILFESQELSVKCEISNIFVSLTYNSKKINENISDFDCLTKLLELTYLNCCQLISNILIIFGNILGDSSDINNIVSNIPLIYRLKEMLIHDEYEDKNIKQMLLWIVSIIADKIRDDKFIIFVDFIPILDKYFEKGYYKDEEILFYLLSILYNFSRDEKHMPEALMKTNIVKFIAAIMDGDCLNRKNISPCMKIIGNLIYCSDCFADIFINFKVPEILEKLLNTFMNSKSEKDVAIINDVLWLAGNFAGGSEDHVDKIFLHTNLPKLVMNINKFKKNNSILKESLYLFFNALVKGTNIVIIEVLKLEVMNLVCEAINNSDDPELLILSFNCVLQLLKVCKKLYNTHMSVKNDLIDHKSLMKIEKCMNSKNNLISKKATQIINILDMDRDIFETRMDLEG